MVDDEHYNVQGINIILKIAIKNLGLDQDLIDIITDHSFNGEEALHMVQNMGYQFHKAYGLIIMDCSMPVMDGY